MTRWSLRQRWIAAALLTALVAVIAAAVGIRNRHARDDLMRADPEAILGDPVLARTALTIGQRGFVRYCAACHGSGGPDEARGIPDLTDQDFLYGNGKVPEIEQIILHGIRSGDPRGWNLASMPAYAQARPYAGEPIPPMTPLQIRDVVEFLRFKHGVATDPAAAARGGVLYSGSGGCWDCHGRDGGGDEAIGAPNLLDDIWLYGGSPAVLERTIRGGRAGMSPAFARVMAPVEARAIAVYVASLAQGPHRKDRT